MASPGSPANCNARAVSSGSVFAGSGHDIRHFMLFNSMRENMRVAGFRVNIEPDIHECCSRVYDKAYLRVDPRLP